MSEPKPPTFNRKLTTLSVQLPAGSLTDWIVSRHPEVLDATEMLMRDQVMRQGWEE